MRLRIGWILFRAAKIARVINSKAVIVLYKLRHSVQNGINEELPYLRVKLKLLFRVFFLKFLSHVVCCASFVRATKSDEVNIA
jgi:hypothetical protein